jgi:hypothetical protein
MSFLTAFGQNGKVMHLNIHANSLEQNLAEESLDVSLGIYLPPGYEKQSKKKIPCSVLVTWIFWMEKHNRQDGLGRQRGSE